MEANRSNLLIKLVTILILTSVILTACAPSQTQVVPEKEELTKPAEAAKPEEKQPTTASGWDYGKFNPPIDFSTAGFVSPNTRFINNETIDDNVHTRWVRDNLGINIVHPFTIKGEGSDLEQKYRLMLASGEEFPDLVTLVNGPLIQELIDSGKFMDIGPLYEQYAGPTLKKLLTDNPSWWWPYMRNGKKYAFPQPDNPAVSDSVLWVRRDWLKKVGLEAPTTIAELEKVMDAFVTKDPDGNGQNDTFGLGIALKSGLGGNGIGGTDWICGAFGTIPGQYNLADDGKTLVYGSLDPKMKDCLAKIKEWKEKGYLHPEVALHDTGKVNELITSGKIGIVTGPWWLPYFPLPDLLKNDPNADYASYALPAGPSGDRLRSGTPGSFYGYLINKNAKHPEAFFTYMNAFYEVLVNADKSKRPNPCAFYENYDYKIIDGKCSTDIASFNGVEVNKYFLTMPTAPNNPYNEWNPDTKEVVDLSRPVETQNAIKILMTSLSEQWTDMFSGSPTPTMVEKQANLDTIETEALVKIATGALPMEEFDKFVEKWKASGGDQILKEVNEWYASVASK